MIETNWVSLWAVYLVEGKGGAGQGGEALVDRGLEGGQEEEDEELETPGKEEGGEVEDEQHLVRG